MAPLLYLLLTVISVLTLARLWSIKQYSVQDGFLFGGLYFFLIPSGLTLILGPIEAEGLFIAPYTGLRLDIACFVALSMLPLIAFSLIKPAVVNDSYDDLLRLQAYFVLSMSVAILVQRKDRGQTLGGPIYHRQPISQCLGRCAVGPQNLHVRSGHDCAETT